MIKGPYYRPWFLQMDPINTYRPFKRNFGKGQILIKSPYYRPWFFAEIRILRKEPNFDKRPLLYRPWFLQMDPINTYRPFKRNFGKGQILIKSPYYRPWFFAEIRILRKEPNFDKRPLLYRPWFLQMDPINTYRPFKRNFGKGQILIKSPYYRPWFFAEIRILRKEPNFDKRPLL